MIRTMMPIEELKVQLQEMGYRFLDWSLGMAESYRYYMETTTVDLALYLPMERVRQGLSEFGPMAVDGWYVVGVRVENGVVTQVGYTFYYTILAERGAVKAEVRLSGRMDAPFPDGRPTEYNLEARLFVGPVAMGKGQKARASRLVEETLASIPAFVEAFPEAKIIAVLETRGGRGGWKRKEAWHVVGRAAAWWGHEVFEKVPVAAIYVGTQRPEWQEHIFRIGFWKSYSVRSPVCPIPRGVPVKTVQTMGSGDPYVVIPERALRALLPWRAVLVDALRK